MVRFSLDKTTSIGRIGLVSRWGDAEIEFKTPSFMMYSRCGQVPHMTWDRMKHVKLRQKHVFQLPIPSMIEFIDAIETWKKGASSFCGMPTGSAVHLSLFDPLGDIRPNFNDNTSVAVWTKSGKTSIDVPLMKRIMAAFRPTSIESLVDYDTPRTCANKRISKAVLRSQSLFSQLFEGKDEIDRPALMASLGGGRSEYHRRQLAATIGAHEKVQAVTPLLYEFTLNRRKEDTKDEEMLSLLKNTWCSLPESRLRFVTGVFDPSQIRFLVQNGMDLFDSSYTVWLAEQGLALQISSDYATTGGFSTIDLRKSSFEPKDGPISEKCRCYTCSHYTKQYVQHLEDTKELLGPCLLFIHNLEEFDRMFEMLREDLAKLQES